MNITRSMKKIVRLAADRRAARLAALAGVCLAAAQASALAPSWRWQWTYGGAPAMENIRCTIQTSDGGYLSVGERQGPIAGSTVDILLIRTDSSGLPVWERIIDGGFDERAYSVVEMTDGAFAVGGDTLSVGAGLETFILKITPAGNVAWGRVYPGNMNGPAPKSARVIQAANGDLVVAGRMRGIGPAGAQHPMLFRVTSAGAPVWSFAYLDARYGQSEIGAFNDVVARPIAGGGDNIVAVGYTSPGPAGALRQSLVVETLANGVPVVSMAYYPLAFDTFANSVTMAPGNNVAFAGRLVPPAMPELTSFMRVDPAYAPIVSRVYQDVEVSIGSLWSLASVGGADAFIIGGSVPQAAGAVNRDLWLARLDAAGVPDWSRHYGGDGDDQGHSTGLSADGLFVSGETASFTAAGDGYVVKTQRDGESGCMEDKFELNVANIPPMPLPIASPFVPIQSVQWNPDATAITLPDRVLCVTCPADLNEDGIVDFSDYLEFLNRFDAGDTRVDYNGDGIVDFADYLEFLNYYDQCS